jgi:hypothetical protein
MQVLVIYIGLIFFLIYHLGSLSPKFGMCEIQSYSARKASAKKSCDWYDRHIHFTAYVAQPSADGDFLLLVIV